MAMTAKQKPLRRQLDRRSAAVDCPNESIMTI
jgi:hypothetical protein